jgi:hypothetical protein
MAVMDTPRESMKKVMEALDILGGTSWRIRAPILDVVEKMWADGGGLANLVDANDVGLPEKPETEDMEEWRRWRFSASEAKRTNKERHSIRCDTEIKLAVCTCPPSHVNKIQYIFCIHGPFMSAVLIYTSLNHLCVFIHLKLWWCGRTKEVSKN